MRFEDEQEIKNTVQAVSHLVNVCGHEDEEFFIREMGREHRTLQQGFTRLCRAWFLYLASREGGGSFDGAFLLEAARSYSIYGFKIPFRAINQPLPHR